MRWVFALVFATGCYGPSPNPGAPCAPGGVCPEGLTCRADICVLPGSVVPGDGPPPPPDGPGQPPDGPPPPNVSGCADGEREGFPDVGAFARIAGCKATWSTPKDMRAARTGTACGDDLNASCAAPADACQEGWSPCGLDGLPSSITDHANNDACASAGGGDGAFAAAMSHCTLADPVCEYVTPYPCVAAGDCSEPVCCGPSCSMDNGCKEGVYQGTTLIGGNIESGCGALDAATVSGVLCCKD